MNVLIVFAHPEPQSFNGALTRLAVQVLEGEGHQVQVSDLYAMGWNPVSDRRNFTTVYNPDFLKPQDEERYATKNAGFAPDVQAEIDKVFACDALIFQFPIWWFALPAILKGWVDRVFAAGVVYGGGKWFDNGAFKGKRALLSLTTGGPDSAFSPNGLNGDIDMILYPVNHGILRYVGFDVLPPFVAWQASRVGAEERAEFLRQYEHRLRNLWSDAPISYPALSEFDPDTLVRQPPARRHEQRPPRSAAPRSRRKIKPRKEEAS